MKHSVFGLPFHSLGRNDILNIVYNRTIIMTIFSIDEKKKELYMVVP
ncbi:hypothetical protein [Anaerocolumna sp.]|nr:hypothetical protein [Anaerocolumna sp.]